MDTVSPGILIVLSGPSGVGKGTICRRLLRLDENICASVSATTRAPRRGEEDGLSYHFLSREEFLRRREQGDFLEWAEVYGNYYGTLKSEVNKLISAGRDVILEIDTQGAEQVCRSSHCLSVFIMPPSRDELFRRLEQRGSESAESLRLRVSKAEEEMAQAVKYSHIIINADLDQAVAELREIISREKKNPRNS